MVAEFNKWGLFINKEDQCNREAKRWVFLNKAQREDREGSL